MRTHFKPLHTLILAGALSTLAGYSIAQSGPGTGPGPAAGHAAHSQGMGHKMGQYDPAKMQARMTQHLADMKAKLKITPAQEAAWTTYAEAVKPTPSMANASSSTEISKLPTPERLDRMRALRAEHMAAMTTQMDQRAEATKTFYAVLSDDQKKVFDEQFNRFAGPMSGHHEGHKSRK
jgi:protein CpxP